MKLTKMKKDFPKDYKVHPRGKDHYALKPKGRDTFKYVIRQNMQVEGTKRLIPKMEHHPVYRLLQDLVEYDLTIREERIEYLAALVVAMLIDDYGLIEKKLFNSNTAIKEINNMSDLNSFIASTEDAEKKLKAIIEHLGIDELNEDKTRHSEPLIEREGGAHGSASSS